MDDAATAAFMESCYRRLKAGLAAAHRRLAAGSGPLRLVLESHLSRQIERRGSGGSSLHLPHSRTCATFFVAACLSLLPCSPLSMAPRAPTPRQSATPSTTASAAA
ncbi:hypothetical protein KBY78_13830 [Synechococcus sp. EJ6-Ellesmere]|nr:hypothetical protein [Synechococcus sp. EJ6-Ellesmere]